MIQIVNKEDCVGCNACVQRCPKQCISMNEDEQGFLYPHVDVSKCIECGLCEKVCPVINQAEERFPKVAYAARNKNEDIQMNSSSGGIFYNLAKSVIEEDGVVFGAKFNEKWEVVHDFTETVDGIKDFQTSKYVQSRIGESFLHVERFLKEGKKVLFSGTPCQIAGLRRFLRKEYGDQLFLIDVACHGVPSPLIWKEYLYSVAKSENYKLENIKSIDFRDKRINWESYGMRIHFEDDQSKKDWFSPKSNNLYLIGFLKDLYLRPSCYKCPAKCGKSDADITIADFWGIRKQYPEYYSEKGVSLILSSSKKAIQIIGNLSCFCNEVSCEFALEGNPALTMSAKRPRTYTLFWKNYAKEGLSILAYTISKTKPSFLRRCINKIQRILMNVR